MKLKITEDKIKIFQCSFCGNKEELVPKLQLISCTDCKKNHYLELFNCKCGEHYYIYQSQDNLRQRQEQASAPEGK